MVDAGTTDFSPGNRYNGMNFDHSAFSTSTSPMETVQLQCGNCGKVMAISTEHLGGQVRCPHCLSVVQTPPRSAPPPMEAPPPVEIVPPPVESGEVESIFSAEPPSEDIFDAGPQKPLVEMPSEVVAGPPPTPAYVPAEYAPSPEAPEAAEAESDAGEFAVTKRAR